MKPDVKQSKKMNADNKKRKPYKKPVTVVAAGNTKNKTDIFLSGKNQGKTEKKSVGDKDIYTVDKIKQSRLSSKQSSFDSGFFGNNTSSTDNAPPSGKMTKNSVDMTVNITKPEKSEPVIIQNDVIEHKIGPPVAPKQKRKPVEVQSAKYRCQPIYKVEMTTTSPVHNHDSANLSMIREEVGNNRHHHGYKPPSLTKRWNSMKLDSAQERVGFLPRSAEIKEYYEASKENRNHKQKQPSSKNHNSNQPAGNLHNSEPHDHIEMKKRIRTQSLKQYPIERTVIGSASPKLHKKSSSIRTAVSAPTSPCPSPTLFDADLEREKVLAFAHALETAAWRKRSFSFNRY